MAFVDEHVKILQLYVQGLLSRRTTIEKLGMVDDVDEEIERIEKEETERVQKGLA